MKCSDCEYAYKVKASVKIHLESKHIDTGGLLVKIVKNLFQQGMLLSKQLDSKKYETSTEDGQVMHQCTDCEYMNPVKDIIRNHVESHHMSTSFACPTRNALRVHRHRKHKE